MSSAPMKTLIKIGHRPHSIDRKKYGQPYVSVSYANRKIFSHPGLYVWIVKKQFRVLPLPKRGRAK